MQKVKIIVSVENDEIPYNYEGIAYYNNGIIMFEDNTKKEEYVFDRKVLRLIKKSKNITTIIDFKNQNLTINILGNEIMNQIKVKEITNLEKYIKIIYQVENNSIIFNLKML